MKIKTEKKGASKAVQTSNDEIVNSFMHEIIGSDEWNCRIMFLHTCEGQRSKVPEHYIIDNTDNSIRTVIDEFFSQRSEIKLMIWRKSDGSYSLHQGKI